MNYKIAGTIRQDGRSFKSGQERELIAVLSDEQKADFIERGLLTPVVIEGAPLEEATVGLSDVDPAEIAATYIFSTFGIQRSSDETASQFIENLVADLRALQTENTEAVANLDTAVDARKTAEARQVEVGNQNVELQKQLGDVKAELTKTKGDATRAKTESDKLKTQIEDLQKQLADATKPAPPTS